MKIVFILSIIIFSISCKKQIISQIGMDITNPREGLIINFNGNTNRLYFVKAAISSAKALQIIEYKIINKANGNTISSYLEDDLHGITDTNLEISESMPTGIAQIDAQITCIVTDVDGYKQTKVVNYVLVQ